MARDADGGETIEGRDDLVRWLEGGSKPPSLHRIGTEHEKFPFRRADLRPVPYGGERGIRALLEGVAAATGWEPILEEGLPIGLADPQGGAAISLEPGGQFELSGAPLDNAHETLAETLRHRLDLQRVADPLGIGFLALGMSPVWSRAETPVMPKARYAIMAQYMPKVGGLGLDMMFRTCTVQVNLDYTDERDMVRKLRLGLALQPVVTALFAHSPFTDGLPNGFLSRRSAIWLDTDPHRTGMLPFAFEPGMGFERYVDYALDVPMYFIKRQGGYLDATGTSFRDFLAARHPLVPGEKPSMADWVNHLSTIFPEVRLKRFLEMRGADMGPLPMVPALAALWAGLFADTMALDAGEALAAGWSEADRQALRAAVPRQGLAASVAGRRVREIARDMLGIAAQGLARRARFDAAGHDERIHLAPLEGIIDRGQTGAEQRLQQYATAWDADIRLVFDDARF